MAVQILILPMVQKMDPELQEDLDRLCLQVAPCLQVGPGTH